jgi:hypothetical protein
MDGFDEADADRVLVIVREGLLVVVIERVAVSVAI